MTTAAIQANFNPEFVTRQEFTEFKGEFYDFRDEVYTRFDDVYVYVDKRFKEQRKEISEDMDRRFSDQERKINENMDKRFKEQQVAIDERFREQSKEHAQMNGAFYEKIHDEIKTALEYMQLYVEAKLADKKA